MSAHPVDPRSSRSSGLPVRLLVASLAVALIAVVCETRVLAGETARNGPRFEVVEAPALPAALSAARVAAAGSPGAPVRPLGMVATDYDEDGFPDLVVGYGDAAGGFLALHRGNPDSVYPNAPEARQRRESGSFHDFPFYPPVELFELPESPDFLVAGDFDGDGHQDVVAAARGSRALHLLSGDGRGRLGAARRVGLPGEATALAAGEINRPDGLADVAVGVTGSDGPLVLVFEGPEGVPRSAPAAFRVAASPSALLVANLDGDHLRDLAVAAGDRLLLIGGHEGGPARVEKVTLGFEPVAITAGHFVAAPEWRADLALLDGDGIVHFLQRGDGREGAATKRARWTTQRTLSAELPADQILPVRVWGGPAQDLALLDRARSRVRLAPADEAGRSGTFESALAGNPVAMLAMRLSPDAMSDLVVLQGTANLAKGGLVVVRTATLATFTVNSAGDDSDYLPGDGNCSTIMGPCTLRAAIEEANALSGADAIHFAIGSGPQTIAPLSFLPAISESVTLDATTQPGFAGTPIIEIDGSGTSAFGMRLVSSGSSTVRGLVVNRFDGRAIWAMENHQTIIEGNYVGVDVAGTADLGNGGMGIEVSTSSNVIGGTTAQARNVVSGNGSTGIYVSAGGGNVVRGNYVGTDATGTAPLGNDGMGIVVRRDTVVGGALAGSGNLVSGNDHAGIALDDSGNIVTNNLVGTDAGGTVGLGNLLSPGIRIEGEANTIGGSTPAVRNVVSGHAANAIEFWWVWTPAFNVVRGNLIGTQIDGSSPLGNDGAGIWVVGEDNTIGGTGGRANVIAYNSGDGIFVDSGSSNVLGPNRTHSNGELGIDLAPDGVTPNDPTDADSGANGLQNHPTLTAATGCGAGTTIDGVLNSADGASYTLDFFVSDMCDPSFYGEGQEYLGSAVVTLPGGSYAEPFSVGLPTGVMAGSYITATATGTYGDTSEFSNCVVATGHQLAVDQVIVSGGDGDGVIELNECSNLEIVLENQGGSPATGITAVLSAGTPGAVVTQPVSGYPDIPPSGLDSNVTPFQISTSPLFSCGAVIDASLEVATSEGSCILLLPLPTGTPASPLILNSTGSITIPDGDPGGADSPIVVPSFPETVTATTVSLYVAHTRDSDLELSLVAPDHTAVRLATNVGGEGEDFGIDCPADDGDDTIFDDEALVPAVVGTPPFAGEFRPEEPLAIYSGLAGADVAGTWNLHAVDELVRYLGTIECWTLTFERAACSDGGGECYAAEVESLQWSSGSNEGLEWDPALNATSYNLYEGAPPGLPNLLDPLDDSCRRVTTTSLATGDVLTGTPPSGSFFWYLVRGVNALGEGPAGEASAGPRDQDSSGTCP